MFDTTTFLGDLASKIVQNGAVSLEKNLIILPNKRAKRVLQKEIAGCLDKPCFSPTILTINEFIESLSPLKSIAKEELILHLFECFHEMESFKEEPFQQFLSWGPIFLSDLNEIDLQLADAELIFTNLAEAKEIETSFLKCELSENQITYLKFYVQLSELYNLFHKKLKSHHVGYEGLIYREVAEQFLHSESHNPKIINQYTFYKKIIFAGFHALSPSEMIILEYFYHRFGAEFIFDIDHLYDAQYAPFVKTLQNRLRIPDIHIKDYFRTIPKEIHITAVPGQMNQIYHAIDILKEIEKKQGNLDHTVLVLGDESLVVPFVHAFDCTKANLTMGYPIKNSNPYLLLEVIFRLLKNGERFFKIQNGKEIIYYHKDVISFIQNPLIIHAFFGNIESANKVVNEIISNNRIFINQKDLPAVIPPFSHGGLRLFEELISFFDKISVHYSYESPDFHIITTIIEQLHELIQTLSASECLPLLYDLRSLDFFVFSKLGTLTIPFIGDFNKGLQVCGLLETRTLDYKNIIFLSINEGVLPKGKSQPSLIMFDIKNYFKLPTTTYKDSIFAYHFFRLMQRSSLVYILYDNDSSTTLAEKSRFISQLEFEIENRKLSDTVKIIKNNINNPVKSKPIESQSIVIYKDQRIIDKLMKINFSPSGLSTFIRCPLAFYFSQIEKLELPDSVDENVENKLIGTIVHAILETIFEEIRLNRSQWNFIFDRYLQDIDTIVTHFFKKNEDIKNADISKGKIYLATEIVKKNVMAFIKVSQNEFADQNIEVLGNEITLLAKQETRFGEVQLKGKIDRIDVRSNRITILDYKTGKVDPKKLELKDPEKLLTDEKQKQLFQLLMYLYMYKKEDSDHQLLKTEQYQAGIISFKEVLLQNPDFIYYATNAIEKKDKSIFITSELIDIIGVMIKVLIEKILNPELPFIQTDEISHCTYCDFSSICRKGVSDTNY
jgi:ATP-dependent helicase/nuclease subunit B